MKPLSSGDSSNAPQHIGHDDAAYVLGALSPEETQRWDRHLQTCARCQAAVAEVSRLPALLDLVPADQATDQAASTADRPPLPTSLLPELLRRSEQLERHGRRVHAAVTAGIAAAAAIVTGVVVGLGTGPNTGPSAEPAAKPDDSVTFTATQAAPLSMRADLTSVLWGTRIELTCDYASASASRYGDAGGPYALVVVTADGGRQQVATWRAVPGRSVTVAASTGVPLASIASLDVIDALGTVLLTVDR